MRISGWGLWDNILVYLWNKQRGPVWLERLNDYERPGKAFKTIVKTWTFILTEKGSYWKKSKTPDFFILILTAFLR